MNAPVLQNFMHAFGRELWVSYYKQAADVRPTGLEQLFQHLRKYFLAWKWYEVYDFLEFTLNFYYIVAPDLVKRINDVLERELSGYRFVGGVFTDITHPEEVAMLDEALADNDMPGVRLHLQRALQLLSNREHPDYRNSIKESISAVESLAKTITRNEKATLGDALKTIEKSGKAHPALLGGFSKLYGYTNDEGGIRHAMMEEPNLSAADAKFFLLSCTSFINYLKSKM